MPNAYLSSDSRFMHSPDISLSCKAERAYIRESSINLLRSCLGEGDLCAGEKRGSQQQSAATCLYSSCVGAMKVKERRSNFGYAR
jgi:hypothetical protein